MECFKQALDLNHDDSVSRLYLERCRYYGKNPPAPDWDGVYVIETK